MSDRIEGRRFYHGTKADLAVGDLIVVGRVSNYGSRRPSKFVYLTSLCVSCTVWGMETHAT